MLLNILHTDVLVLGAGLAGMRAAWAALEAEPGLKVMVVSSRVGPSGSSFTNINDKLGMQVCLTGDERDTFVQEAISIAPPGYIDPDLVRILAEESEARFHELDAIGFPFDKDEQGEYFRATGCFSPREKRAFIYTGLATAFEKLRDKFLLLGGQFLAGWLIQDLVKHDQGDSPGVYGAVLQKATDDTKIAVKARSVIFALGGPASLFIQNVSGTGTHGIAYALLKRAGVKLVNTSYLQFLWHTIRTRQFWPIQSSIKEGVLVRNRQGVMLPVPGSLSSLSGERSSHAPVGYGTADAAIDQFFIENLSPNGEIDVFDSENGWTTITLMAHAGNGGAKIDADAWTGINGLYACGESASGMHGANRIGGAMVMGTQVFGWRAGKASVDYVAKTSPVDESTFRCLVESIVCFQREDEKERREIIPWLRQGMQVVAIMGGQPGLDSFVSECIESLASAQDWRVRLALEAAIIVGKG